MNKLTISIAISLFVLTTTAEAQQIITDDLIVQGRQCVGDGCSDTESFGFITQKLKSNNTSIQFDDTSTTVGFPSNDWQLTVNDSGSGGFSYFSIDDDTAGTTPFRVDAGAPTASLYILGSGNIGLGTSLPQTDLHMVSGASPKLRLEQDDSMGFNAYIWDIAADDTAFRINDLNDSGVSPLVIKNNSGDNALVLAADGVGISTASPQADLHITSGLVPRLRLEQDTSSGFNPHIWDIQADDGSLRIVDQTSGTFSPVVIKKGSADSLLVLDTGHVGIGTINPETTLHVKQFDATLVVEEDNLTPAPRTLFSLRNTGNTKFTLHNLEVNENWAFANPGTGFRISRQGSGVVEFDLLNNGNLTIAGTLTENSDRNAKTNIININQQEILNKITRLPIQQWQYKDAPGENHIGPMAQDFYATFGLGATDKGIATLDSSGVALAAIQALAIKNQQLEAEVAALKTQNNRLLELEAVVLEIKQRQLATPLLSSVANH